MNKSPTTFSHLWQLGRLIRSRMGVAVALSLPQVEALHFVAEQHSPTMRELANYLKVKAPSATALVAEMVRAGLLKRVAGADRREVALVLTRKGTKCFAETLSTRKRVVTEVLSELPARERAEFDRLLKAIINANKN